MSELSAEALSLLFTDARTHSHWLDRTLEPELLQRLYALLKWGPTSANSGPGRFVFVQSPEAKARLKPCLAAGNVAQTMAAPVTVIVAKDLQFYEHLPLLFPHTDARSWYEGKPQAIQEAADRNSTLQGAYLIMAARSLGLDCGPMSGFNAAMLNQTFFPEGRWQANFLVNLGYGDPAALRPRQPRLSFEQACQVL